MRDPFRDDRSRAGRAPTSQGHRALGRDGGGGPWRDLTEVRGAGGKGPKGDGQDDRPFLPRQEAESENPARYPCPKGRSHKTPAASAALLSRGTPQAGAPRAAPAGSSPPRTSAEREAARRALPTEAKHGKARA